MTKKAEAKAVPAPTRDELRTLLLGSKHESESKLITLWGIEIELRQASLKDVLKASDTDDAETNAVNMVIRYAYVPGTNERIFEPADKDVILSWPFGEDMQKLQKIVGELTGITEEDLEAAKAEMKDNPLKG